jgi:hypothetical protein
MCKKWKESMSVRPYGYVPLARTHKVVQTLTFYVEKGKFEVVYGLVKLL